MQILFHWPKYLFLCQYHIVFNNINLQYVLRSGTAIPLNIVIFAQNCFVIFDFCGSMLFFSLSVMTKMGVLVEIAFTLKISFGRMINFYNMLNYEL